MSLLQRGCIKSIQRISHQFTNESSTPDSIDINISPVNIDKTIIIMHQYNSRSNDHIDAVVTFNSNISIHIAQTQGPSQSNFIHFVDIQLVEFY